MRSAGFVIIRLILVVPLTISLMETKSWSRFPAASQKGALLTLPLLSGLWLVAGLIVPICYGWRESAEIAIVDGNMIAMAISAAASLIIGRKMPVGLAGSLTSFLSWVVVGGLLVAR